MKRLLKIFFCFRTMCPIGLLILLLILSRAAAAEGLKWGRFYFQPALGVVGEYTDNAFLEHVDEKDDKVVTVSPELTNQIALTENSRIKLRYRGDYSYHSNYETLDKSKNEGYAHWGIQFPAGSSFVMGGKAIEDSVQPLSEDKKESPFLLSNFFTDTTIKVGSFTEIGFRYDYQEMDFDHSDIDDYKRNKVKVDYVNRYFSRLPFLMEYRFTDNKRSEEAGSDIDSQTNEFYIGGRWTPETRLSGNLRVGYLTKNYKGIPDSKTVAVDTKLMYRLTDFTSLQLRVERRIEDSTTVKNEVGNNLTLTRWEAGAGYRFSEPLRFSLRSGVKKKEFRRDPYREDNIYFTRFIIKYRFSKFLNLLLNYQYRNANSTDITEEYSENSIKVGFQLKL